RLRRWFAGKDQPLQSVEVSYAVPLPNAADIYLAEIAAHVGGNKQHYAVPVALVWEETLPAQPQQLALARVRRGPDVGMVTDAFVMRGFAHAVLEALLHGAEVRVAGKDGDGRLRFVAQPGLAERGLSSASSIEWLR